MLASAQSAVVNHQTTAAEIPMLASAQSATEISIAITNRHRSDRTVPVRTVNRQCSSGFQAVADVAATIKAGFCDIGDYIYKVSSQSPTRHFIIHSRKALLNETSPADNRKIPPLKAMSDQNAFEVESENRDAVSTFYDTITTSFERLDICIDNATSNKKSLASALDSVVNLVKEVELKEKAAKEAKAEAATSGLDILAKLEELKQKHTTTK
ncbi:hypothetical protein SSX86_019453 [Deinandra increscens subsp. villosa]|uniref:Uncharacterized protein n=1 Tax=Deinandra increscens subsp. villosa TaxID=3103831 RepID=A0AAP0CY02_9ASTR